MNIIELKKKIKKANTAYRSGNAIMSDYEYDLLIDELKELSPNDELLIQVGGQISDSRKETLPTRMASMNKVKTVEEIHQWIKSKKIPDTTSFVLTPKYDGLSLLTNTKGNAWTRGNGIVGQRSDEHYKVVFPTKIKDDNVELFVGEVIVSKKKFLDYADRFANARNMVAGIMNSKQVPEEIIACDYIRYGHISNQSKIKQLEVCNSLNDVKVPFQMCSVNKFTTEYLLNLYNLWKKDYEIDGIIIEVNDAKLRESLGVETGTGNPCYARAYKGNFEEVKETEIVNIEWNVSKQGLVKPVGIVNPVSLDGAIVTRVTLCNSRYVEDNKIGIGTIVKLKRSGMVIPMIVSIVKSTGSILPCVCPSCGTDLIHYEVESVCKNNDCIAQRINKIISFFSIMEVENVGEGVLTAFYDAGYDTVAKILNMTQKDMEKIDRFGDRKAEICFTNIHSKMKDVELSKLQHASGCFKGLGSTKLKLVESYSWEYLNDEPMDFADILNVEGFAKKSVNEYISGMAYFSDFIEGLPITIKKKEIKKVGGSMKGMVFCFTGYRDKSVEGVIETNGGEISNSITKSTTHLVMKEKGSGSSKETKAIKMGIKVIDKDELDRMIA